MIPTTAAPHGKAVMDDETPSVRTSIHRWLRQLTIQGERELPVEERAELLRTINPPFVDRIEVRAKLSDEQQQQIDDGVQRIIRARGYELAAHLAIDELLIMKLRNATGASRGEILQTVSLALEDVPPITFDDTDEDEPPTTPA